jgi:hypothetical protein
MPFLRPIDAKPGSSPAASVASFDLILLSSVARDKRLRWFDRWIGAVSLLARQPYRLNARRYRWDLLRRFAAETARSSAHVGDSS